MEKSIQLSGRIGISVRTSEAEGTTLTRLDLDPTSCVASAPGVQVLAYVVEPGASTVVALPEIEIKVEFPLFGVVRLVPPYDFCAGSRVGMWYDNRWQTNALGYEPFALFLGANGECRILVGVGNLEYSTAVHAHVYGGPAENVPSGVKGIGAVHIRRNAAEHAHFKGTAARSFEDAIYVDTAGGDAYAAVGRYFAWLRENYYPQSPVMPPGTDEVLWHSWYAHQGIIDQDIIREQARLARDLDIRRIQIDAFWDVPRLSTSIWGGNVADPERFPDFRGLIDELHAAGQRVAVHMNPFVVSPDHFSAQDHLKPLLLHTGGNPFQGEYQNNLLCPRCPGTRDYILSCLRRIVGEYGFDEVWYDFVDDLAQLYGECDNRNHAHEDGTPGEHVVAILREMEREARRLNPEACLWGRRRETNPITRQWETHVMPHDRYLDYLGNLRECLFLHQLAHRQRVQFVPTNWPVGGEDPRVVARHMIAGVFAGVPGVSVDLARQSPEILEIIRTYVAFYRQNKSWLNTTPRRLVCPEDAIRCVSVEGPDCCWFLCIGTAPSLLRVPEHVREVRVFSCTSEDLAFLLLVQGEWSAVQCDHVLKTAGELPLERLSGGVFVRSRGNPLFSVIARRADGG